MDSQHLTEILNMLKHTHVCQIRYQNIENPFRMRCKTLAIEGFIPLQVQDDRFTVPGSTFVPLEFAFTTFKPRCLLLNCRSVKGIFYGIRGEQDLANLIPIYIIPVDQPNGIMLQFCTCSSGDNFRQVPEQNPDGTYSISELGGLVKSCRPCLVSVK